MLVLHKWSIILYATIFYVLTFFSGCNLIDHESFLARTGAWLKYEEGLHNINNGAKIAISSMLESFEIFPTVSVAKKLSWLADIVGDQPSVYKWQQMQALHENSTILGWMNEGILRHYNGDYETALEQYDKLLAINPHNVDALYHKGVTYQYRGDIQRAAQHYYDTIDIDPFNTRAILNLAALHQKYGSPSDAITFYLKGVEVFSILHQNSNNAELPYFHPHYSMVLYNLGLAYMQINQLDKAYSTTKELLRRLHEIDKLLKENDVSGTFNYQHPYDPWEITQSIGGALGSLSKIQRAALNWAEWEALHHQLVVYTLTGIEHARSHYCDDALGVEEDCQISYYGQNRRKIAFLGPLLPFDTLMQPMSMQDRLEIAIATSLSYKAISYEDAMKDAVVSFSHTESNFKEIKREGGRKLRLGFISYDFNDHPTAHLIIAIFDIIADQLKSQSQCNSMTSMLGTMDGDNGVGDSRCAGGGIFETVELFVFSYGRDDQSLYRKSLEKQAHKFIDISPMSFSESAAIIRSEGINILLDLQIHTLGSRLEITASGVAPTVVNYLVFPGTSGAVFYDYLAVDEVVVPPEHAQYYTESLLVLPPTYQISSYSAYVPPHIDVDELQHGSENKKNNDEEEGEVEKEVVKEVVKEEEQRVKLRRLFGLPVDPAAVVFCNFNKINKIDPESFALWIQVMLLVPRGYLWLLEPSDSGSDGSNITLSKTSILISAVAAGVSRNRIIFAGRSSKAQHIFRHTAADLFLDTIVYGAHSTATDALRGGLPVLTLKGESFPSRVAASLYASFIYSHSHYSATCSDACHVEGLMVADSAKDFVDTAIRLFSRQHRMGRTTALPDLISVKDAMDKSLAHGRVAYTLSSTINRVIISKTGLFNATRNVESFVRSMQAVEEVRTIQSLFLSNIHDKRFHIIIR